VQGKLEMILGAAAAFMELSLKDHTGALIAKLDDNDAMLGAYPVEDFLELYALDKNPHNTAATFEAIDSVDKIEMAQEEYDKRTSLSFFVGSLQCCVTSSVPWQSSWLATTPSHIYQNGLSFFVEPRFGLTLEWLVSTRC
jgi:hypothetical protein